MKEVNGKKNTLELRASPFKRSTCKQRFIRQGEREVVRLLVFFSSYKTYPSDLTSSHVRTR